MCILETSSLLLLLETKKLKVTQALLGSEDNSRCNVYHEVSI